MFQDSINKEKYNKTAIQKYCKCIKEVEKPSRYIGGEWNSICGADKNDVDYRAVMAYPDVYEIGQANQAVSILYKVLNSSPNIFCERAFLPWVDMAALMRERDVPLLTLESQMPVRNADFLGITLSHELVATNVLEFLDLSKIPLRSIKRGESDPIVFGGGPCAYNPEPYSDFFDAFFIGEGEELDLLVAQEHRKMRNAGASRKEILENLAQFEGVYVPSLYKLKVYEAQNIPVEINDEKVCTLVSPIQDSAAPEIIKKVVVKDFDASDALGNMIVPYCELIHDRLNIEILRGCSRGCRFCQAGMIYRPVRERSCDNIMAALAQGMACTGYDEVALSSLSSTDHSKIKETLMRVKRRLEGSGCSISLPSQRVDSFGIELANLVSGEKKSGLTLAPEAGSQRLRDIINKGVEEEDIINAVSSVFSSGWRRLKLYFMIGLPHETDDDVAEIGKLCERVLKAANEAMNYSSNNNKICSSQNNSQCVSNEIKNKKQGKGARAQITVSVALFIPKPMTPFQWDGQIDKKTIQHRIGVLRESMPKKNVTLHWHDAPTSYIEAALARGGRECCELIEAAWRNGARFDAWSEQFNFDAWVAGEKESGINILEKATHTFREDDALPWSHISCGITQEFLLKERERAALGIKTPDCTFENCSLCGVCENIDVKVCLQGKRG